MRFSSRVLIIVGRTDVGETLNFWWNRTIGELTVSVDLNTSWSPFHDLVVMPGLHLDFYEYLLLPLRIRDTVKVGLCNCTFCFPSLKRAALRVRSSSTLRVPL